MKFNMSDLIKFAALFARVRAEFERAQRLLTGEGRWTELQDWLEGHPNIRHNLQEILRLPKKEAAEYVTYLIVSELTDEIQWGDFEEMLQMAELMKPEETAAIRARAENLVGTFQILYRERNERDEPKKIQPQSAQRKKGTGKKAK